MLGNSAVMFTCGDIKKTIKISLDGTLQQIALVLNPYQYCSRNSNRPLPVFIAQ